jgi:multidrug efflux pump subunit AcrA (membrane-fusion protein)
VSLSARRLAAAGVLLLASATLALAALGGRELTENASTVRVLRSDLVWNAEVEGELASRERVDVGPPPVPNTEFKLAFLADEGAEVAQGDVLLRFDTQLLEPRLQ